MRYLLITLSLVVICASCTQTPATPSPDKESILRTGKWKLLSGNVTMRVAGGSHDTTMDYIQFIPTCHADDYIIFDSTNHGAVYSGATKCSVADADSISFIWRLLNNDNNMDILNVFNFFYNVHDSIDANNFTVDAVTLDTSWTCYYVSRIPGANQVYYSGINIYNGTITNFSKTNFTYSFKYISDYPDTNYHHTGTMVGSTADPSPIYRADTFTFAFTFTNF